MERRDVVKLLATLPLATWALGCDGVERAQEQATAARGDGRTALPGGAVPVFFNALEWRTVAVLVDMVIPKDDRSGSATDAGVPEFMDFIMLDNPGNQARMRNGLGWLNARARARFGKPFPDVTVAERTTLIDEIAFPKKASKDVADGVQFFNSFRDLTATGFYSSEIGIKDLAYQGNVALASWTGCPPNVLRHIGATAVAFLVLLGACSPSTPNNSASSTGASEGLLSDAVVNSGLAVHVSFPASKSAAALDGRLLLLVSSDSTNEPRFQISDGATTQLVFGTDAEDWLPDTPLSVDRTSNAYPLSTLEALPPGRYWVQAMLNRYETFTRSDGHTVKLPPDMGEGQQWSRKPGNLYSAPAWITLNATADAVPSLVLDQEVAPIAPPEDTPWIKHITIRSERLSKFWGRDMFIGANVLLPAGFAEHPEARYPLVVNHGHFPATLTGFRIEPPDPNLAPDFSARFNLPGYNRIQQELTHQFYKDWTGPNFPRVLLMEVRHPTPYYDDSYAVNSPNQGPYGDAIMYELIPEVERQFRGIGEGWARITYGGSTGGWEAMAVQVMYPDEFNGAFIACPDPIDFRAYTVLNLYEDRNAYFVDAAWKRTPRPGHRDYLGHVSTTLQQANQREAALGSRGRSGDQWDIWQATFSPVGDDGYPKPIWDKKSGVIDTAVAAFWRENYDLMHIVRRDWKTLGPKLYDKLNIYVGDMDNYYLNNAVYLAEQDLRVLTNPTWTGEITYGDRDEHCWNGDSTRSNAYSRLRYHQMYIPRILDRMRARAPRAADTLSWRY